MKRKLLFDEFDLLGPRESRRPTPGIRQVHLIAYALRRCCLHVLLQPFQGGHSVRLWRYGGACQRPDSQGRRAPASLDEDNVEFSSPAASAKFQPNSRRHSQLQLAPKGTAATICCAASARFCGYLTAIVVGTDRRPSQGRRGRGLGFPLTVPCLANIFLLARSIQAIAGRWPRSFTKDASAAPAVDRKSLGVFSSLSNERFHRSA